MNDNIYPRWSTLEKVKAKFSISAPHLWMIMNFFTAYFRCWVVSNNQQQFINVCFVLDDIRQQQVLVRFEPTSIKIRGVKTGPSDSKYPYIMTGVFTTINHWSMSNVKHLYSLALIEFYRLCCNVAIILGNWRLSSLCFDARWLDLIVYRPWIQVSCISVFVN